jgi:hypothetical protein
MTRYYFHLTTCESIITDDEGEEFETVAEARAYAVRVAGELAAARRHPLCDLSRMFVV